MRTVITICGSMRFANDMEAKAKQLIKNGYNVKLPVKNGRETYTDDELEAIHKNKIATSDAILVMNIGGYIGESTRKEIEYAKRKGIDIFYIESNEPELYSKPVPEPDYLTYNDIINVLSHMIDVEQDEPDELAALNMLENEINKLINRLKSESPSQTPAEP